MIELLWIYIWTIVAGSFSAIVLSFWGAQLSARNQAVQVTCISQSAMLGVLLGIGLFSGLHDDILKSVMPTFFGLVFAAGISRLSEALASKSSSTQSTTFISIFGLLLALNSLVGSLFPGLERHLSQIFFGDLATISERNAQVFVLIGIILAFLNVMFWKPITKRSFNWALFDHKKMKPFSSVYIIELGNFIFLCLCVQYLGFLFTLCALFIPSTFSRLFFIQSLSDYRLIIGLSSFLSVPFGFLLSLRFTSLPTVPTIAMAMVLVVFMIGSIAKLKNVIFLEVPKQK